MYKPKGKGSKTIHKEGSIKTTGKAYECIICGRVHWFKNNSEMLKGGWTRIVITDPNFQRGFNYCSEKCMNGLFKMSGLAKIRKKVKEMMGVKDSKTIIKDLTKGKVKK